MFSALLYLRFTSLRNWLRVRLQRLRQPKYFAGAIVGALYFWFFFLRRSFIPPVAGPGSPRTLQQAGHAIQTAGIDLPPDFSGVPLAVGALAVVVIVTLAWLLSLERASLGFSEAEIAFLFPAPITRRGLVHFRLLDAQLRSLLGALFMTLFSNRWMFFGGNTLTHAFGWWLIFAAFNLHLVGVRFTLTRLADAGLSTWPRRAIVLLIPVAIVAVTLALRPAGERWVDPTAAVVPATKAWFLAVTSSAPLAWLLALPKFLLGPFFAGDWREFLIALGPAALVLLLHYVWVARSVVSFEEGSIDRAEKRAAIITAIREGKRLGGAPTKGRKPAFTLRGKGRPEFAFLWKNLLGAWPWFNARVWSWCALVIVGAATWARLNPAWQRWLMVGGALAVGLSLYTLIVGPQFARQDIRSDLANADLLKTYPLPGWQIVLGELLAPTAILTGILWLFLLAAAFAFQPKAHTFALLPPALDAFLRACLAPGSRALLTLCLAPVVPAVVAIQLFVPNAAALVLPAWFQATRQRGGGGIDVMGQRLIFFFLQMLTMLVALLPAAIAAAAVVYVACFLFSLPPIVGVWIAAAGVLAVLLGELWLGLQFLGARFERLDLSAEIRP